MDWFIQLAVVVFFSVLYVVFFYKASGSLSIRCLNLNSLSFYYTLFFTYIGGSSIYLGFRNHYLVNKVDEYYIEKTYFILIYSLIVLPAFIILWNKIMNVSDYRKFYSSYTQKLVSISSRNNTNMYFVVVLLTLVGILALSYTIYHIGYVPLVKLFVGGIDFNVERINISRGFTGNIYVRNIFALTLIPFISYLAYIYMRVTKENKWKVLFILLFGMSLICKTYSFEKAPVVIYLFYFYFIEILIGKRINYRLFLNFVLVGSIILFLFYYVISGYRGNILSFTNGPLSRLCITQVATLFLHIQTFPDIVPYLDGSSFPRTIGYFISDAEFGVRSGRVVMEVFNPGGVAAGVAGVMNTLFVGEAYANYGYFGVFIAPIVIGSVISVVPNFVLKQDKQPINITIYVILSSCYTTALVGGFVDFIYNFVLIFMLVILISIKIILNKGMICIKF